MVDEYRHERHDVYREAGILGGVKHCPGGEQCNPGGGGGICSSQVSINRKHNEINRILCMSASKLLCNYSN